MKPEQTGCDNFGAISLVYHALTGPAANPRTRLGRATTNAACDVLVGFTTEREPCQLLAGRTATAVRSHFAFRPTDGTEVLGCRPVLPANLIQQPGFGDRRRVVY